MDTHEQVLDHTQHTTSSPVSPFPDSSDSSGSAPESHESTPTNTTSTTTTTLQAKLLLDSNAYTSWTWVTMDTRRTLTPETDPWLPEITSDVLMTNHWFNHDIVEFTISVDTNQLVSYRLFHSVIRQTVPLAGILLMNKVHGRASRSKFWYRCIPNDKRLPSFLIPYAWNGVKQGGASFSKHPVNQFVVFRFSQWNGTDPHPVGELLDRLGDVSSLQAFYEYQLYSRSLHSSIAQFVNATRRALHRKNQTELIEDCMRDPRYRIEDRTHEQVYSIDPPHCRDIDDAFHVEEWYESGDAPCDVVDAPKTLRGWKVSIYISNVPIWLDILELWNAFSNRVATIYLPDRKRPMMPTQLSDNLCSLREHCDRFAFALDMYVSASTAQVESSSFHVCRIRVSKNYHYDDPELVDNPMYLLFHRIAFLMNSQHPYVDKRLFTRDASPSVAVKENHCVISFWMIQMNYLVATHLRTHKTGLFRTASLQPSKTMHSSHLPETMLSFLQVWKSSGGSYVNMCDAPSLAHELLHVDAYVHVTSPIRRIADLLNMIEIMRIEGLGFREECTATAFYRHWTSHAQLEYMNTSMRAIRRVQQDCELIAKCVDHPERLNVPVEGYVFDGINKTDGLYQYTVYFPDGQWKMISRCITQQKCAEFSKHVFRLYMFECGETTRKKIKVEMIE